MGWWSKDEEEKKPEPEAKEEKKDSARQISDIVAKYAEYARTRSVKRDDILVEEYREAHRIDEDNWRVLDVSVYDLGKKNDKKITKKETGDNVKYHEAMVMLAQFELMPQHTTFEYTGESVEELGDDYFLKSAYREGIIFDKAGYPHVKQYGHIVTPGQFLQSEIDEAAKVEEAAKDNPPKVSHMEPGVLADMFSEVAVTRGNLDDALNKYVALGTMDELVSDITAFKSAIDTYAAKINGKDADVTRFGKEHKLASLDETQLLDFALTKLSDATDKIPALKDKGVYTEPYEKMIAQCEVCTHLMNAQVALNRLKDRSGHEMSSVETIRSSVDQAERKFRTLGATDHEVDRLRAWVMSGDEPKVPGYIGDFVTRYKAKRDEVIEKLQKRPKQAKVATLGG